MQDHLKERLTGAAIVVVVVVLLVPELFRGPPISAAGARATGAAGPPVRSYTIDLRDNPAIAPPPSAPMPALPSAATLSVPLPVAVSTPTAAGAQGGIEARPSTAAPTATKVVAASPSAHALGGKSGWTVQVGSFARRDYAERMVKQVAAKGYSVEVAGPDDRGLFRVRTAPQSEHSVAIALKQKMKASGLKPIVNSAP